MLRISSSAEYALRVMAALARAPEGGPVSAETLSKEERVPRDFVDQLLLRLRRANLVESRRGVQGGYRLAHAPEKVSVGRVIRAVDAGVFSGVCGKYQGGRKCSHKDGCGIRPVWETLGGLVERFLDRLTLRELSGKETSVQTRIARMFQGSELETVRNAKTR